MATASEERGAFWEVKAPPDFAMPSVGHLASVSISFLQSRMGTVPLTRM